MLALPEGYEGLISAGEAGELLMLGLEGGEYTLRVLDTASGALSEPVSLAEARTDELGSGTEIFYSDGLFAAVDNGTLIAALREDGFFPPVHELRHKRAARVRPREGGVRRAGVLRL